MPKPAFTLKTMVDVSAETAFDYVSDLSKHGEWAANDLSVMALDDGPVQVGKQYVSSADVGSLHFDANLTITKIGRPTTFAFSGDDKTGEFSHTFTFEASGTGATITRQLNFDLTPMQYMMYLLLYFPVRLPAGRAAMDNLKARLETS